MRARSGFVAGAGVVLGLEYAAAVIWARVERRRAMRMLSDYAKTISGRSL